MNPQNRRNQTEKEEDASLRETVQKRAYELFLKRGKQPGHELEDWLQAEREISSKKGRHRTKV